MRGGRDSNPTRAHCPPHQGPNRKRLITRRGRREGDHQVVAFCYDGRAIARSPSLDAEGTQQARDSENGRCERVRKRASYHGITGQAPGSPGLEKPIPRVGFCFELTY